MFTNVLAFALRYQSFALSSFLALSQSCLAFSGHLVCSHGHADELFALDGAASESVPDGGAIGVPTDAAVVAAACTASAAGGDVSRVVFRSHLVLILKDKPRVSWGNFKYQLQLRQWFITHFLFLQVIINVAGTGVTSSSWLVSNPQDKVN